MNLKIGSRLSQKRDRITEGKSSMTYNNVRLVIPAGMIYIVWSCRNRKPESGTTRAHLIAFERYSCQIRCIAISSTGWFAIIFPIEWTNLKGISSSLYHATVLCRYTLERRDKMHLFIYMLERTPNYDNKYISTSCFQNEIISDGFK